MSGREGGREGGEREGGNGTRAHLAFGDLTDGGIDLEVEIG